MANLEVKNKMSAFQFGLFLTSIILGTQFVSLPNQLVPTAGQFAWVSVILGGTLFFGVTWIMVKLAAMYPNKDFTQYLPQLLGKWLGISVISVLLLWDIILICLGQNQFSRVLVFYMFDRTPPDVVFMSMLAVIIYCVLQDFGTIVRVAQFTFIVAISMISIIWSAGIFNFQPENLLPLKIDKPLDVLQAALRTWPTYSGYEVILLLYPLIGKKRNELVKIVGVSFSFVTLICVWIIVMSIGVLSVETIKVETYPTMDVVRTIELPGTFIERLENYFLLAWIPMIFNAQSLLVFMLARIMSNLWGFADHRPWTMALVPLIFTITTLLDSLELIAFAGEVLILIGASFSLGIIPLVYFYAKWKNKGLPAGG